MYIIFYSFFLKGRRTKYDYFITVFKNNTTDIYLELTVGTKVNYSDLWEQSGRERKIIKIDFDLYLRIEGCRNLIL